MLTSGLVPPPSGKIDCGEFVSSSEIHVDSYKIHVRVKADQVKAKAIK